MPCSDVRTAREADQDNTLVRKYQADGLLYAYRDDSQNEDATAEHVIVSRGNEPRDQWVKRVPAERTAVVPGEQLWTIPDNWTHRATITETAELAYGIYHIPETDVHVLVMTPNKTHLVDAWYHVKRVGDLAVTYDDSCDWDELNRLIDKARDTDAVDDAVVDALEQLSRRHTRFERLFEDAVNKYAPEAVFERPHASSPLRFNGWTTDPWHDTVEYDDVLRDVLAVDDDETLAAVRRDLKEANIIPRYPEVRVDVVADEGLPNEFYLRGLIQAGCSPPEATDYLMTELHGFSQTEWATERGKQQPSISDNVSNAETHLDA